MKLRKVRGSGNYRRKRNEKGRLVYHHDWVWEHVHHKKIPRNHVIHHLDGNRENNHPGNLACISKSKNIELSDPSSYYPKKWRVKK